MRTIVFDTETRNVFSDVASNDPAALDLSVVCIWDSQTDSYSHYFQEDLPKLWPIIESADALVGFNSDHFDIPLLAKYYTGNLGNILSIDIMKAVKESLGRRIKLDSIAEATLGKKKIGHGLEAIVWWRNGELDKLVKYCIEDVKITKEVYEYALKHKELKFTDKITGATRSITINTTSWQPKKKQAATGSLF